MRALLLCTGVPRMRARFVHRVRTETRSGRRMNRYQVASRRQHISRVANYSLLLFRSYGFMVNFIVHGFRDALRKSGDQAVPVAALMLQQCSCKHARPDQPHSSLQRPGPLRVSAHQRLRSPRRGRFLSPCTDGRGTRAK